MFVVKKASENWLKIAQKDLNVAKKLVAEEEPMAFIFHLHAALEKLLKALCVETQGEPPRIHNLRKLAIQACQIKLENDQAELFTRLDESFIDSRYPVDIDEFEALYSVEECRELLKRVEVSFKWLKSLMNKS